MKSYAIAVFAAAAVAMTGERRRGLLIMGPLAFVAMYMFVDGLAALLTLVGEVAARAEWVVAYAGDVAVVPGAVAMLLIAAIEVFRAPERWRTRMLGASLLFFGGMIMLPIAFMLFLGPVLSANGYTRCPERVVGATLPAARYGLQPDICRSPY